MSRLVSLGLTLPTRQYAHEMAKALFGPKRTFAQDFLVRA
jgi:hypothetical protein